MSEFSLHYVMRAHACLKYSAAVRHLKTSYRVNIDNKQQSTYQQKRNYTREGLPEIKHCKIFKGRRTYYEEPLYNCSCAFQHL